MRSRSRRGRRRSRSERRARREILFDRCGSRSRPARHRRAATPVRNPENRFPVGEERVVQRLTPSLSRARNSVSRFRSQSANVNILPRNARRRASPQASHAWTITSVSLLVRNTWPSAATSEIDLVVVNFTVVDDDEALAVLVEDRLPSDRDVDDRQAAMAEPQARLDVDAAFVGAAMVLRDSFVRATFAQFHLSARLLRILRLSAHRSFFIFRIE